MAVTNRQAFATLHALSPGQAQVAGTSAGRRQTVHVVRGEAVWDLHSRVTGLPMTELPPELPNRRCYFGAQLAFELIMSTPTAATGT
jgi:hypothetical protein